MKYVIYLLCALVIIVVAGIGVYLLLSDTFNLGGATGPEQWACTMEAKLCPDGSSVGRTGPNCEFAACPSQ